MRIQTGCITNLQVRELDTTPVAVGMESTAFVDDGGLLRFKITIPQTDGSFLVETIIFNRYETQKIRAVLGKT